MPGHCCPYCVNPEIGFEAPVEGATGKYGGKKSVECPNVPAGPHLLKMQARTKSGTHGNPANKFQYSVVNLMFPKAILDFMQASV